MRNFRTLGEAEARIAIDACLGELRRLGKSGVVTVADTHGELIGLWRTDRSPLAPIVIAQNKAYTAARLRQPSGQVGREMHAKGEDMHYHGDSRYLGWDGGLPVIRDGECLGAVAISGLTGEEDVAIAQVGVAAIMETLD